MTAIVRVELRGGKIQLAETGVIEAAITLKEPALGADDGSGRDRRQFVLTIGFAKFTMRNVGAAQAFETAKEFAFVRNGQNDETGMRGFGGNEKPADVENGVTRLDDLLRKGQTGPDEDVNVRDAV